MKLDSPVLPLAPWLFCSATALAAPPVGLEVPNVGFHDVATPFHNATYEEEHLRISNSLRSNFSYAYCRPAT